MGSWGVEGVVWFTLTWKGPPSVWLSVGRGVSWRGRARQEDRLQEMSLGAWGAGWGSGVEIQNSWVEQCERA